MILYFHSQILKIILSFSSISYILKKIRQKETQE